MSILSLTNTLVKKRRNITPPDIVIPGFVPSNRFVDELGNRLTDENTNVLGEA